MKLSTLRRPSPATVIATLALFVAVGGPAEAARLINGASIRKGTVRSKQIKDHSLLSRDLNRGTVGYLRSTPAGSVGAAQLQEGAVGAGNLQPGSVTAAALAGNAISGAGIEDGSVANADLAPNAVTTDKIADNTIRKVDIGSNSVGRSELAPSAVSGTEIADGTLGAADVTDAYGTVSYDFGAVSANSCVDSTDLKVPNLLGDGSLADDAIVATAPTDLYGQFTTSARPGATAGTVVVRLCNVTASDVSGSGGALAFRVAGIDLG